MLMYVEFGKPVNDYCEVLSLSWGMSSPQAAGGASVRAQVNDLSFTKERDTLGSALFRHCAMGTLFGTVSVELYRNADSDVFLVYKMSDVYITAFNASGSTEFVGLNYKTVKYTYYAE